MSHVQYIMSRLTDQNSTLWTTSMVHPKPQFAVHVALFLSAARDHSARQDDAVAHAQSAGPSNATGGCCQLLNCQDRHHLFMA